jgi:hyperosmotically inducible protein
MRRSFIQATAIALLSAIAVIACSSTPTQRSAGEATDDTVLLGKVKAALVDNDAVKANQVNVEVNKGVVALNGTVATQAEKDAAAKAAKGVTGVKEVRNDIKVSTKVAADRSAGEVVDDATITGKIKAKLIEDPTTKAHQINVDTRDGVVQLGGFVDSAAAKDRAGELAHSVGGVKDVQNELQVKSQQ